MIGSRWRVLRVVVIAFLLALRARAGVAEDAVACPLIDGGTPALAATSCGDRLSFIQAALRDDGRKASDWTWTWVGINGALTAGQVAALPFTHYYRPDLVVGSVLSALGAVTPLVMPLTSRWDQPDLDEAVTAAGGDATKVLPSAERRLREAADSEAIGVGPISQASGIALSAAELLVLGLGYHHWVSGAEGAASGILVTELMIFTQPTGAMRALRDYRAGNLREQTSGLSWRWMPQIGAGFGGLTVAASF